MESYNLIFFHKLNYSPTTIDICWWTRSIYYGELSLGVDIASFIPAAGIRVAANKTRPASQCTVGLDGGFFEVCCVNT